MTDQEKLKAAEAKAEAYRARARDIEKGRQAAEKAAAAALQAIIDKGRLFLQEAKGLNQAGKEKAEAAEALQNEEAKEAAKRQAADLFKLAKSRNAAAAHYLEAAQIFADEYARSYGGKKPQAEALERDEADQWAAATAELLRLTHNSQVKLAEKTGLTFATINRLLKGYHKPALKTKNKLRRYAKSQGLDMDKIAAQYATGEVNK